MSKKTKRLIRKHETQIQSLIITVQQLAGLVLDMEEKLEEDLDIQQQDGEPLSAVELLRKESARQRDLVNGQLLGSVSQRQSWAFELAAAWLACRNDQSLSERWVRLTPEIEEFLEKGNVPEEPGYTVSDIIEHLENRIEALQKCIDSSEKGPNPTSYYQAKQSGLTQTLQMVKRRVARQGPVNEEPTAEPTSWCLFISEHDVWLAYVEDATITRGYPDDIKFPCGVYRRQRLDLGDQWCWLFKADGVVLDLRALERILSYLERYKGLCEGLLKPQDQDATH